MTARRHSRRRRHLCTCRRCRRTGRLGLFERVMLAGIAGEVVYLVAGHLPHLPAGIAPVAGWVAFGFALALLIVARPRLPYVRSPVGWRRWR
jgi:hypothetical protein